MSLRSRTISPVHAKDYRLFCAEIDNGLPLRAVYMLLHLACDRDGRFGWDLSALRSLICPYDSSENFERALVALVKAGLVSAYAVAGKRFGMINDFSQTQQINGRELPSDLPGPECAESTHFMPRVTAAAKTEPTRRPTAPSSEKTSEPVPPKSDAPAEVTPEDLGPLFGGTLAEAPKTDLFADDRFRYIQRHGQHFRVASDGRRTLVSGPDDVSETVTFIPVNGDRDHLELGVSLGYLDTVMRPAFPHLDLVLVINGAAVWSRSNPSQRKTMAGLARFINTWFTNEQNNPRSAAKGLVPMGQGGGARESRSDANLGVATRYLDRKNQQDTGAGAPSAGERVVSQDGEVIRDTHNTQGGRGATRNAFMRPAPAEIVVQDGREL